jgi:primosomal protein N'
MTGKLLSRKGCTVSVVKWESHQKGVDDLIAAEGVDVFETAYRDRVVLDRWFVDRAFTLDRYLAHRINQRYLDPEILPKKAAGKIIALKSAKGTGKTEALAHAIKPFVESGKGVLVITHRIQLARTLADRLGIAHIEEVRKEGGFLVTLFVSILCTPTPRLISTPKRGKARQSSSMKLSS